MTVKSATNTHRFNQIPNLYLVVLKFRFPPLNMIQEAPNILSFLPAHADSVLLFADMVASSSNADWRYDFMKLSLSHNFDRVNPRSLFFSEEYNSPLSTVFIPVISELNGCIELFMPTDHPRILKIYISKSLALVKEISDFSKASREEILWLRKRDDISKLGIMNSSYFKLLGTTTSIGSRSGGYRSINLLLKVPIEYMTTRIAFFASVENKDILNKELSVLRKTGIGKKRDMGLGDLIEWNILDVKFDKNIGIVEPMLLLYNEKSVTRIVTLRNTKPVFIANLKEKGQILPINIKLIPSRTKPPYWIREELCIAPFSEFLFK